MAGAAAGKRAQACVALLADSLRLSCIVGSDADLNVRVLLRIGRERIALREEAESVRIPATRKLHGIEQ